MTNNGPIPAAPRVWLAFGLIVLLLVMLAVPGQPSLAEAAVSPTALVEDNPDCSGGEIYDDGEFELSIGALNGSSAHAMLFDGMGPLTAYDQVCIGISRRREDAPSTLRFYISVREDDQAGGTPGSEINFLGPQTIEVPTLNQCEWFAVDTRHFRPGEEAVFIVVSLSGGISTSPTDPNYTLCGDESGSSERVYSWNGQEWVSYSFLVSAMAIRAMPDISLPVVTIDAPITFNISDPSFTLKASEPLVSFECSLNGSAWASCPSPYQPSGMDDGVHTLAVRGIDRVGNQSAQPTEHEFSIDTQEPDTQIVSGPAEGEVVAQEDVEFTFDSSEDGVSFECRLDGGDWEACSDQHIFVGLSEGEHTVDARAKDAAGNVDSNPATRTFSVDTIAPTTMFESGPVDGSVVPAGTVTFEFTSSEQFSTFECSLDAGDWRSCTSPHTLEDLLEGTHTFSVRATDVAGNLEKSPPEISFTVDLAAPVDTVPPDTSITAGPLDGAIVDSDRVTYSFASTEAGSTFECAFDTGPWTSCPAVHTLEGFGGGPHTLRVRAVDAAGNRDPDPAERSFIPRFDDVSESHVFDTEVHWLALGEITRGCNPPGNDRFCPDDPVTRGQVAAFVVRALDLPAGEGGFVDSVGHLFEDEIAALASAGVTRGCNPPGNDRFCPDDPVTRGQVAAFVVRALDLPAGEGGFVDSVGHLFEDEIAALASAGVTRGCNPPGNDRYCPDEPITRAQMAALLHRALTP